VRTATALGAGARSLAGSAVNLADHRLGGLEGRTALVLGAGEMAAAAARRLRERGVGRLLVANRTFARAAALATQGGGRAIPWEWRCAALRETDVLICATGAPEAVIGGDDLRQAAEGRPALVAVDLGVPRNLEAPEPPVGNLFLADVFALGRALDAQAARRRDAVRDAEVLIEEELGRYWAWVETRGPSSVGLASVRRVDAAG
jgi:glutamyl-tRNA reductase